jgi:hypothetical protein
MPGARQSLPKIVGRLLRVIFATGVALVLTGEVRTAVTPGGTLFADPAPAGAAGAAAVILDSLVIRVYDSTGIMPPERARAISRADSILSRADIDIEWIECPAPKAGRISPSCSTPPAPGELVVRLVNAPSGEQSARRQALGYSLIDMATGTGTMATLFLDRITRLANGARFERATVLGRALAHEVGHLILGSNEHSATGIMRENWTAADLVNSTAREWQFLPSQGQQMRHARINSTGGAATAGGDSRLPQGG